MLIREEQFEKDKKCKPIGKKVLEIKYLKNETFTIKLQIAQKFQPISIFKYIFYYEIISHQQHLCQTALFVCCVKQTK